MNKKLLLLSFIIGLSCTIARAQLTLLGSFNPSSTTTLCGIGYDPDSGHVWIYGCSDNNIQCYNDTGLLLYTVPVVGGTANDVDLEITHVPLMLNGTLLPKGQLLFINGESGVAEIYALDNATGAPVDTLVTSFGGSHVVGGSHHVPRNSFFLLQDNVPGPAEENQIAEIDLLTGDTLQTFQIGSFFDVYFGDLATGANGNLYIVSSDEDSIAEVTPLGGFVQKHSLPAGVTSLSGIALDCASGQVWVAGNGGLVYRLGNFPCGGAFSVPEIGSQPFSLGPLSPNPFAGETSFSMIVRQPGNFRLVLLNMLGEETKVIYEGHLAAGEKQFSLSGTGISKGVYLLRAAGKDFTAMKRVVCVE